MPTGVGPVRGRNDRPKTRIPSGASRQTEFAVVSKHMKLNLATTLFCILFVGAAQAADGDFSCRAGHGTHGVTTMQTTLAGVPAIVRLPVTIKKPPIVLWHGLGPPAGDSELMDALPLDDVPAVKVYLELPLFGARAPSDDADSLAHRQAEDYASRIFEPVVLGAAKELPAVLQALREKGCLRADDKIGLFGFSAGGAAVLNALMDTGVPVGAAVTVNAPVSLNAAIEALERATKRPYVWSDSARLLAERSDSISHAAQIAGGTPPRALLLFHGADDTIVAPSGAVSLNAALQPFYRRPGDDRRLKLVIAPGISHGWTELEPLRQLRVSVADWFNTYLTATGKA
jgi:alpha-beta hydrolase superfamily lysophospholipase